MPEDEPSENGLMDLRTRIPRRLKLNMERAKLFRGITKEEIVTRALDEYFRNHPSGV